MQFVRNNNDLTHLWLDVTCIDDDGLAHFNGLAEMGKAMCYQQSDGRPTGMIGAENPTEKHPQCDQRGGRSGPSSGTSKQSCVFVVTPSASSSLRIGVG